MRGGHEKFSQVFSGYITGIQGMITSIQRVMYGWVKRIFNCLIKIQQVSQMIKKVSDENSNGGHENFTVFTGWVTGIQGVHKNLTGMSREFFNVNSRDPIWCFMII